MTGQPRAPTPAVPAEPLPADPDSPTALTTPPEQLSVGDSTTEARQREGMRKTLIFPSPTGDDERADYMSKHNIYDGKVAMHTDLFQV